MEKEEIKKLLPHRDPMLLVDRVTLTEDGKAMGQYTVKGDEFFLQGHFPGNPVVPGVILCEMMAQACCVLFSDKIEGSTPFFTGLNNVKFKNKVVPGDTIDFECEITRSLGNFFFASGKGTVNNKLAVSGDFSFALVKNNTV
ncbi:MAG: beta-hydroxyacyl-ACP dehydratase [Bacillales bacterium]|jgi:3-hydroxyacyl-[acyl-carrier-protein] dehydratase|nr:beta-hydroxyacyl-ACP dehydratase [Bacillales bacterium]